MKQPTKTHLILFSLIVIGTIIRLYNLGFQDTNWDERFTMEFAGLSFSFAQVFINSLTIDFTPPLYYLAAHLSMIIFGQNPWAIRIPSLIFGVLLIPVMFLIGKEYKDELFGLLLAGLTTIFYNIYFYSKYGRSYAMGLVWFALAFYFFMRLIKGDKHSGIYFGLFAVLSIWTHLYSAIPLGIMVLYLLWERRALDGILLMVIGCLPLLNYINVILVQRCIGGGTCMWAITNSFGATPWQIFFLTPLDMFGYSVFVILPVIIWTIWKHRDEKIITIVATISLVTWGSMFVLAFKTPMVLHYALFLVPMLLMVFILPFYKSVYSGWKIPYIFVAIMVLVMECYQLYLINFIQRGGTF